MIENQLDFRGNFRAERSVVLKCKGKQSRASYGVPTSAEPHMAFLPVHNHTYGSYSDL